MTVNKRLVYSLALAAVILATSAMLTYAQSLDLVGPDVARRTMQILIGLVLAGYANLMPKDIGRMRGTVQAAARSQSALRVGGWSLALAGLGYAGVWAFAPIEVADSASTAIVVAAMLVTLAYGGRTLLACRRTGSSASTESF